MVIHIRLLEIYYKSNIYFSWKVCYTFLQLNYHYVIYNLMSHVSNILALKKKKKKKRRKVHIYIWFFFFFFKCESVSDTCKLGRKGVNLNKNRQHDRQWINVNQEKVRRIIKNLEAKKKKKKKKKKNQEFEALCWLKISLLIFLVKRRPRR